MNAYTELFPVVVPLPGTSVRDREKKVVVLYSSLSTCDPGDVHETIAKLKTHKVRASVVGLGAEMVSESHVAVPFGWPSHSGDTKKIYGSRSHARQDFD